MAGDVTTQRAYLYAELVRRFKDNALWDNIEPELATRTASLPEPTSPDATERLIKGVQDLKSYLADQGVGEKALTWLDEEVARHKNTKQLSLFREIDDTVTTEDLNRFCTLSFMSEGVIGIAQDFNYEQLRRITNAVYQKTGNIKFFISDATTLNGSINAELYEHVNDVPVARLWCEKKGDGIAAVTLFGQNTLDKKKWGMLKEITAPFHTYAFTSTRNEEYILLSVDPIDLGDFEVHGVATQVQDMKRLTDSSKLDTKLRFFFVHHVVGSTVEFPSDEAFFTWLDEKEAVRQDLFDFPFTFSVKNPDKRRGDNKQERILAVQKLPHWFKRFIWAWLLHSPQGVGNPWPLHLVIIGPPSCGKTTLVENLDRIGLETQPIFKGEDSTIKGVVPSFKKNPPERGYLIASRRFSFLDEFFRCLANITDEETRGEALGRMNSILEHKTCKFGSGMGSLTARMRSRAIFNNNPPSRSCTGVEDLLRIYDKALLSRSLIYWQHEQSEHTQRIRHAKKQELQRYEPPIKDVEFVSIIEYAWTFSASWDEEKFEAIYQEPLPVLSEALRDHYEARHRHHLECLMDGVIKTRCILNGDRRWHATPEDYKTVSTIWGAVIRSWINAERIQALPTGHRVHYLPEAAQWLWSLITGAKETLTARELEEKALRGMRKDEFITAYTILRSHGLLTDDDGFIKPYFKQQGYDGETISVTHDEVQM